MKKTLLTVALVAMSAVASFAQGTIAFGNSVAARISVKESPEAAARTATAADGLTFGVFFGPAGSAEGALTQAPGTATIGAATPGILTGAASVFALPGTDAQQIVSLQIRAWDSTGKVLGATDVRQVTLGPTAGPGAVIWQGASGVNQTRFNPLVVTVPEPSTIALGVLGLGSLLLFRRRK